jgi:preprotein translocase SecE subunit
MVLIFVAALGCREVYAWWPSSSKDHALVSGRWFERLPLFGVPLSLKFLVCAVAFVGLMYLLRWWMRRPSTATTLVETELEMRKVSWPTKQESINAMWVVVFVTVVLTVMLGVFDLALTRLLKLVF